MREQVKKAAEFFRNKDKTASCFYWMLTETKPFFRSLLLVVLLNLIITAAGIGSTVITKFIIDGVIGAGPDNTKAGIAVLIVLSVFSIAASAAGGVIAAYINERYAFGIRNKVYDKLLYGTWLKIKAFHSGDIVTRLTSDVNSVSNGISVILPNIFFLLIKLIAAFWVLYYYDHFLALAALFLGPAGVLLSFFFSIKFKKYQEELNRVESEYRSFIQETIENITVIKTFEKEHDSSTKLCELRDRRLKLVLKRNNLNMAVGLCIRSAFFLGYLLAFCWSIYRLSTNSITYGTMTIFLALVSQVQEPIINLGSLIPQLVMVTASAQRILEINSIDSEATASRCISDDETNVGLKAHNLTFGYGSEPVLENVELDIKPNDVIGIVGSSGSGKTTFAALILSLIHPDEGRLNFYDEKGNKESVSAAARRFVSYVPQGNTLITGSIAENVRDGKKNATEKDIWEALEIADAATFVKELEAGLNTLVGENGTGLSEGQAQRIAIARAVIKAAPITILDEATSSLDAATEGRITDQLSRDKRLHTCFIITHRRSMLKYCTRAFEVKNKKLNEIQF